MPSSSTVMAQHNEGARVSWKWGASTAHGTVKDRFARRVQRTIKGQKITRNWTDANAALLIEQADGDRVLKLESEVEKV